METLTKNIKAVIFDMDGTIIKTEHAWSQATHDLLRQRGFPTLTKKQHTALTSLSGIGLLEAAKIIKTAFNLTESIEQISDEIKLLAHKIFETDLQFIDGFEKFHKKLQSLSIPTSIATNADLASLLFLNQKMSLNKFFGGNLYSIEMIGNKAKPKPDIFLHAAKQLNVKPSECVVFEDSLFGFQAAIAAGMKCIAIKNQTNQKNIGLAQHAISSYDEAEEALAKILSK